VEAVDAGPYAEDAPLCADGGTNWVGCSASADAFFTDGTTYADATGGGAYARDTGGTYSRETGGTYSRETGGTYADEIGGDAYGDGGPGSADRRVDDTTAPFGIGPIALWTSDGGARMVSRNGVSSGMLERCRRTLA
jgi:hypothetical protein